MSLTSHGSTIHDLAKEENIVIRGSITGGNIFLPEHRLDLEDVKGIATISRGILEGENIEARLGSARGTKGLLRLDLKGEPTRFHLDIAVTADVAELPPYLKGSGGGRGVPGRAGASSRRFGETRREGWFSIGAQAEPR